MEIVTDFSIGENDSMGIILYRQGTFWDFMETVCSFLVIYAFILL